MHIDRKDYIPLLGCFETYNDVNANTKLFPTAGKINDGILGKNASVYALAP